MKTFIAGTLLCAGAPAGVVAATTFPALVRKPVVKATLPASNPLVKLVRGAGITFAPGQPTGLHYHPEPTVGVVTKAASASSPRVSPNASSRPGTPSSNRRITRS